MVQLMIFGLDALAYTAPVPQLQTAPFSAINELTTSSVPDPAM
jgi:hypothetical protein